MRIAPRHLLRGTYFATVCAATASAQHRAVGGLTCHYPLPPTSTRRGTCNR